MGTKLVPVCFTSLYFLLEMYSNLILKMEAMFYPLTRLHGLQQSEILVLKKQKVTPKVSRPTSAKLK
jgi:hypothetical protein